MPLYVGDNEIFGGDASNPQDTKVNDLDLKFKTNGFSGSNSVGVGKGQLIEATKATTAVGDLAHGGNQGFGNTVVGARALQGAGDGSVGNNNTAVGLQAGASVSSDFNTVVGGEAWGAGTLGGAVVSGGRNTIIGQKAGYLLNSGEKNVFIGWLAGTGGNTVAGSMKTGSNNVFIGTNGLDVTDPVDNHILLGDGNITDLFCAATTIQFLSDERDKKAIRGVTAGLDLVNDLRPVEFIWDARDKDLERNGSKDCGFIAQELKAVQEKYGLSEELKLVNETAFEDKMTAAPGRLLPILVKAIQELSAEIAELKSK